MGLRMVSPVRLDRIPELLQSFFIGVAVLHNEPGHALGMLQGKAPSYGCPVIHNVHGVAHKTELIEQTVDQFAEAVEGISELAPVWHIALPVSRVVGSDQMVAVRQGRNQVAEHVGRCWESMQEQNGWCARHAGLAVENIYSVDLDHPVMSQRNDC